jgi:glycosyltransferase involved in cell wall biosynthesis
MLTNTCGLGQSARLCYEALRGVSSDVWGVDITADIGQRQTLPSFAFRCGRHLSGPGTLIVHMNGDWLPTVMTSLGKRFVGGKYVVGVWHWEQETVAPSWKHGAACCHEIWAPSRFTTEAVRPALRRGQPLATVPHPVAIASRLASIDRRSPRSGPFTFLSMFETGSSVFRKNPHDLAAAFRLAISGREDARLLVKIGNQAARTGYIDEAIAALARTPNVDIVQGFLDEEQMIALYARADAYILLSRSEGFGLPFVEAMLAGLPAIGIPWSGQADILTDGVSLPVRYRLIPTNDPHGIYDPHQRWASPDVEHAAQLMRRLIADPGAARRMGLAARAHALTAFGPEAYVRNVAPRLNLEVRS